MADIPQNPFDKDALDRLEDAVDLSRVLVDNANELNRIYKKAGTAIQDPFAKATKSLAKSLNEMSTQISKMSVDEFKRSDAIKLQKKLTEDISKLKTEQARIEQNTLPVAQSKADLAKRLKTAAEAAYRTARLQFGATSTEASLAKDRLDTAIRVNDKAKESLRIEQDAVRTAGELLTASEKENDQLSTYIERWDQVNLRMGLFGKAIKGLKKIPILGDLLNADKALKAMQKSALDGENAFKTMGKGISAAFEGIEKSTVILAIIGAIVKVAKFFVDLMFEADKQITEIGRELLVTRGAAVQVRDRFEEITATLDSGESSMGKLPAHMIVLRKETVAAQSTLNSLFGTTVDYTQALGESGRVTLEQFAAVSKMMRLTEEEQKGLAQTQVQTGKNASELEKTVIATAVLYKNQTGYLINQRKVFGEVLTTTNAIKLTIKGGTDSLIKSVINAQHLGINLEKVRDITSGLLDFESSIQSQLEAELLTGKSIALDKLRYAVLTNDAVTQTEELNKLVREGGTNLQKNRIAMESYAKAAGMSVEEFSDMYTQQLAIEKVKVAINKLGTSEIEKIIKQQKLTADIARQLREGTLGGTALYNILKDAGKSTSDFFTAETEQALAQQSAQEKFNTILERTKEIFSSFVEGGYLQDLANLLTDVIGTVGKHGIGGLFSVFGKSDFEKEQERNKLKRADETVKNLQGRTGLTDEEKAQLQEAQQTRQELGSTEARYLRDHQIQAADFTIQTHPKDTLKIMGGTRLGETDDKMLKQLEIQNKYLAMIAAKDYTLDGQRITNGVARNVPTTYGNLLNPGANAFG